jgi:hypothetical protein
MITSRMLVPLVAVALLAGCTTVPASSTEPTARPATSKESKPEPVTLEEGTVVATGRFTSVDGLTTGDVAITADDEGGFTVEISRFASPVTGELILNSSTEPFTEEAYCAEGFSTYVQGNLTPAPEMTIDLGFDELTSGDPSYLDTLILTLNAAEPRTGCFSPVVALAPLTWTMPDLRPDIRVVDRGETGGASGWVTVDGDRPLSYTVAPDDLLPEIAARFGVSVDDLLYLNPTRSTPGLTRKAYVDEVFNLDRAAR